MGRLTVVRRIRLQDRNRPLFDLLPVYDKRPIYLLAYNGPERRKWNDDPIFGVKPTLANLLSIARRPAHNVKPGGNNAELSKYSIGASTLTTSKPVGVREESIYRKCVRLAFERRYVYRQRTAAPVHCGPVMLKLNRSSAPGQLRKVRAHIV